MFDEKSYSLKMDKTIEVFSKELSSLRTGRANASMLDLIKVDVYGQQMPINQLGSITTPEPRTINIQVWDLNNVALIDAALRFVALYDPEWWVLENPVGRLRRWLGPPTHMFNPCDYGDPYTKKTLLWGKFNIPKENPVPPQKVCKQGSWIQKLGGSSDRTRS